MHLGSSLNQSDHLHKVLKQATARIKFLVGIRKSMSMFAAKSVCTAHFLFAIPHEHQDEKHVPTSIRTKNMSPRASGRKTQQQENSHLICVKTLFLK